MLSLFVCFVKDNIILDIAVVFGISTALAVLSGCITVVLLRTVLQKAPYPGWRIQGLPV